jgi:hypothetical protein
MTPSPLKRQVTDVKEGVRPAPSGFTAHDAESAARVIKWTSITGAKVMADENESQRGRVSQSTYLVGNDRDELSIGNALGISHLAIPG